MTTGAANVLVPVCLSASHIAYGSIRMEPVFFALGQVAGTAAAQAVLGNVSVQDVDYGKLRQRLVNDGQVVSHHNLISARKPRTTSHEPRTAKIWYNVRHGEDQTHTLWRGGLRRNT